MDIDYLLTLQYFRNNINDVLTPFMEMLSLFAVTYLVILPAFIYWCVDKRVGLYSVGSYAASVTANAIIKLSCCIYRPWIRDSRVLPAGNAIETATGYSFPSGHTMTAVPIYGSLALATWKKMRWVSILSLAILIVTCFSRNYLGVHTPQDVLVGIAVGALVLWGMAVLFRYLAEHPEKEDWFLLGGVLLSIAALVYFSVKQYPRDYDKVMADGTVKEVLRVDPLKMMKDGFGDTGKLLAFCIGRFIEKKWIRFKPAFTKRSLAAGIVGVVVLLVLIELFGGPMLSSSPVKGRSLGDLLKNGLGTQWAALVQNVVIFLHITCGWPLVMKACAKHEEA